MVYGDDKIPNEPSSYFNGQGFALNAEKKSGALIDLHLIKDEEIIELKAKKPKGKFEKITSKQMSIIEIFINVTRNYRQPHNN